MTSHCLLIIPAEETWMKLNNNDAAACIDSISAQVCKESTGEIELYDELIAFAERPSERPAPVESRPEVLSEPNEHSAGNGGNDSFPEPLLVSRSFESDASLVVETDASNSYQLALPEEPSEQAEQDTSQSWIPTSASIQPVEAPTTGFAPESDSDWEVTKESVYTIDVRIPLVEEPGRSDPAAFNLPAEILYTGALSRGVCLACGAESGTNELFCQACGGFEVDSTTTPGPACRDCKQPMGAEEIFCPWCGSAREARR